eukprot:3928283-Alexandrium_andersonii.AAC.1
MDDDETARRACRRRCSRGVRGGRSPPGKARGASRVAGGASHGYWPFSGSAAHLLDVTLDSFSRPMQNADL